MIKCLLTELCRAGRENIWPLVMGHGPRCARSVRHDLGPNIFPSGPPTQSISTYYFLSTELDNLLGDTQCEITGEATYSGGLPGVLGNKGKLAKYPREQGNMSLFFGNRKTKLYKLEEENIVSKFIKRGTNTENVRERGNIGQFWKGTREQGTPLGDPQLL